jgi:GAF domain-containing protein
VPPSFDPRFASPLTTTLRTYPVRDRQAWLYVLLESINDLAFAATRAALAESVALRSRELFGTDVRGIITVLDGNVLSMIPAAANADVPVTSPGPVIAAYAAGQIVEIADLGAYCTARPMFAPWYTAGFRHIVGAAFGSRGQARGYVTYLHYRLMPYSDDELTLFSILAHLVGIALDRIDRESERRN